MPIFNNKASFPITGGRPYVMVKIMGGDGKWHDVNMMLDSGNDITLLTKDTAKAIQMDPKTDGDLFRVAGINGTPDMFFMFTGQMQIGGMSPISTKIGIGPLRDNLLGRNDIFKRYSILFTPNSVHFIENKEGKNQKLNIDELGG